MPRPRLLLVDDEADTREVIAGYFAARDLDVSEAGSCAAALEQARAVRPDAVVLDYALPDGNALELIPRLRELDEATPLIVLTGHGSIDLAVRAVKQGADQFLTKPVELAALAAVVERAIAAGRARRRQLARAAHQRRELVDPFVGTSAAIRRLAADAERIAGAEAPALIVGETGVGKGVLARWLHARSPRAEDAFVDINCAGLSRELLDAELFGHERGAFTGAVQAKAGLLEVAHQGVLFLDEIGDMDPLVQAKLLKVLEEQRFRRLGEVRDRQVDVRLIAATHQDLPALIDSGRFRRDLYFRINALPLAVPPLRERPEDIPALARAVLARLSQDLGHAAATLDDAALAPLVRHPWPGNVRELRNVLERALLLSGAATLTPRDLRFDSAGGRRNAGVPADESDLSLKELERRHIERVLRELRGAVEKAAQRLGISRSTLYQKLRDYGLTSSDFRNS